MPDSAHLDRILQCLDDRLLADDLLKNLGPKFPGNDLIFAHGERTKETGSGDTASHWFTQYRCFLPALAGFSGSNCAAPLTCAVKLVQLEAERVGFEPTVELPPHTLSKRAP